MDKIAESVRKAICCSRCGCEMKREHYVSLVALGELHGWQVAHDGTMVCARCEKETKHADK